MNTFLFSSIPLFLWLVFVRLLKMYENKCEMNRRNLLDEYRVERTRLINEHRSLRSWIRDICIRYPDGGQAIGAHIYLLQIAQIDRVTVHRAQDILQEPGDDLSLDLIIKYRKSVDELRTEIALVKDHLVHLEIVFSNQLALNNKKVRPRVSDLFFEEDPVEI